MKISLINIDGFGIFKDVLVDGLDAPGIVIFYGKNEAGKSTILGFIKTILFGFPHAKSRELSYPPLAGGIHGGRLGLVAKSGEKITVERSPGKKVAGDLKITTSHGQIGSTELLQQLMGGVTFDVFKNIYAFSLSELQSIDTLRDENVKNVIYGATIGSAMLALPKAEKDLGDRLDQLFKPKGHKQLINKKLTEYERIRAQLVNARHSQREFDELVYNLSQVEENIKLIQHNLFEINREQIKTKSYARLWPEWKKYQEDEKALSLIPENIELFPPNGLQKLEDERKSLKVYQATLFDLESEIKQNQTDVKLLVVNHSLIDRGDNINFLREQKNTYSEALTILPVDITKKEELGRSLQQILRNLGKSWTEQKILSIDRSIFTREKIRQFQKDLNDKSNEVTTAEKLQINKKVELDKSIQAIDETTQLINEIAEPEIEIDSQLIQQLQNGRNEFANSIRDLQKSKNQLKSKREKIAGLIREIDLSWNEADISQFDTSLSAKKIIEEFSRRLSKAQQNSHLVKTQLEVHEATLLKSREQLKLAETQLHEGPRPSVVSREELDDIKTSIHRLHQTLFEQKETKLEIRHLEDRLCDKQQELARLAQSTPREFIRISTIFVWVTLFCTVLFFVLFIAFQKWKLALAIGIFFVLAIASAVYRKYEQTKLREVRLTEKQCEFATKEIATIQKDISLNQHLLTEIETRTDKLAKKLKISVPITHDRLSLEEQLIEQNLLLFEQQSQLAHRVDTRKQEVIRVENELDNAKKALERADEDLRNCEDKWKEHLVSLKLSPELTATTVREIYSKIEVIDQQIIASDSVQESIRAMEAISNDYFSIAREVPILGKLAQNASTDLLATVDKLLARQEGQRKRREKYQQAKQLLKEKRKQHSILEKEYQNAYKAHHQLEGKKRAILKHWRDWLVERGLPSDLSPESAMEAFDLISLCTEKIGERNQLNVKIENWKRNIKDYESHTNKLLNELNLPLPNPQMLAVAISELSGDLEESKGKLREKNQIERQIKKDEAKVKSIQLQIDQCHQRIRILLEKGKAFNEEQFYKRGHQFFEQERLSAERVQAERNMRRLSGESDFRNLKTKLKQLSLEDINTQENSLSIKEQDLQNEIEDLRNKRAHLNLRVSEMRSADDIARLRADEERVREEIRGLAFEWSRYAMAKFLIEKAKQKFEKEQQPKVIQDARVFFKKITNSRYHELVAPIGEDTIEAVTSRNQRKKPEELSRGTAEQLYLSIRFGYIRNRSQNGQSLPVIMDDILVNFDPGRVRNAAEAILELSKDHQILFFTCHPETIDIFTTIGKNVTVYKIENNQVYKQN